MPAGPGALFLIVIGSGILAVTWRGWRVGELPAGSRGFQAYRPNRTDNPLAFHFCWSSMGLAAWCWQSGG